MTVDEIKEVQMKKELQRANPIWNYFSGFSYDASVLFDYDLMKKPLRAEESYQKLLQLLELTKQAIVFHPLEKIREKIAIFDCIHDVEKSVISKHNAKLVNSICKIYKERGQNEVAG